jgi:DNA mismatch repair protein MutS
MSLAYAMLEYLASQSQAKVLFSTHYHELTRLVNDYSTIKNYFANVVEEKDNITFTYKIKPGQIDKSYGIHVAKLAHLPQGIIKRAYSILDVLEKSKVDLKDIDLSIKEVVEVNPYEDTINELRSLNINDISPIQALNILSQLQSKVGNYE